MALSRRTFLSSSAAIALALAARPNIAGADGDQSLRFEPLLAPDANGLALPPGFTSRVVARSGQPVANSSYRWPIFPDGGACFETNDGGWYYVANSEHPAVGEGGVGAIRFDRHGEILRARSILTGTTNNCAGGPTPWRTWLSCEEISTGLVWECDPRGRFAGVARPALGTFKHEAVAVDSTRRRLYLTEDEPDGRLYRFTARHHGDLRSGLLEAARVDGKAVTWIEIPDPAATAQPTRLQVPETTPFQGGEGIWWTDGAITFVTKRDHKVWRLDTERECISVLHDALAPGSNGVLGEPDNVTVTDRGDVFITEDQGTDQQVVLVTRKGKVLPVLQLAGHPGSELSGIAFSPSGRRMYISSQRGTDGGPGLGITYEVSGPFRGRQDDQWDSPHRRDHD